MTKPASRRSRDIHDQRQAGSLPDFGDAIKAPGIGDGGVLFVKPYPEAGLNPQKALRAECPRRVKWRD